MKCTVVMCFWKSRWCVRSLSLRSPLALSSFRCCSVSLLTILLSPGKDGWSRLAISHSHSYNSLDLGQWPSLCAPAFCWLRHKTEWPPPSLDTPIVFHTAHLSCHKLSLMICVQSNLPDKPSLTPLMLLCNSSTLHVGDRCQNRPVEDMSTT